MPNEKRPIKRPICTPPGRPRLPNVPVCPPVIRGGFVTPFGGPASGISPGGPTAPSAGPSVIPTPAPTPACITASVFADCFAMCNGTINLGSPGPVCGWTFNSAFTPSGDIVFTPGEMSFDTTTSGDFPSDSKPLSLTTVFGTTLQFSFTEFPVVSVNSTYQVIVNNFDNSETFYIAFFSDGNVLVETGDPAAAPSYLGSWTPTNGSHVVHVSLDALGNPILFMDGVQIPLVFFANLASPASFYPTNSINVIMGSGENGAMSASMSRLFFTMGVLAPDSTFCCPA